jgi:hypothetical protein
MNDAAAPDATPAGVAPDAGIQCSTDADCFADRPLCHTMKHICVVDPPLTPIRPTGCDCHLGPHPSPSVVLPLTLLVAAL